MFSGRELPRACPSSRIPGSPPNHTSLQPVFKTLVPVLGGHREDAGHTQSIRWPTVVPGGPQSGPLSPHLPKAPPPLPTLPLREAELWRGSKPRGAFTCSKETGREGISTPSPPRNGLSFPCTFSFASCRLSEAVDTVSVREGSVSNQQSHE